MSGGRYPYPKHVWATTGGWWPLPTNWKKNTVFAYAGVLTLGVFLASFANPQKPRTAYDEERLQKIQESK